MTINICYASDEGYWRYMATSILSAMLSPRGGDDLLHFWILDNGIPCGAKASLQNLCASHQCDITFCKIDYSKFRNLPSGGPHISNTTYARYDIASLLPETVAKAIWLDCDTIVQESLVPLYNYDLTGYAIGGVLDLGYYIARDARIEGYAQKGFYINSGVMLLNLVKWRECGLSDQLLAYTTMHCRSIRIGDQDVINAVCCGMILKLSYKYNVQDSFPRFDGRKYPTFAEGEAVKRALFSPAIIHYTYKYKPWNTKGVMWSREWIRMYQALPSCCQDKELSDAIKALQETSIMGLLARGLLILRYLLAIIVLPRSCNRYLKKLYRIFHT